MNRIKRFFVKILKYPSLEASEERDYKKYLKEVNRIKFFSDDKISSMYVNTKARYEIQKLAFSIFIVAIFLSLVMGLWSKVFEQFSKFLTIVINQNANDITNFSLQILITTIAILGFIAFVALAVILAVLNMMEFSKKRLLILEEVRNKRLMKGRLKSRKRR